MEYLERRRALVEERLEPVLEAAEPDAMTERLKHVSLSGGKRVRPMVTLLAFEAAGGELTGGSGRPTRAAGDAVDFAVGVELVHNASLVVDDIIDESELRRGGPSAWTAFGHGPAIVTSDGLLGEAFSLFSADSEAIETVSDALVRLGEGEATELLAQPVTEADYLRLARRKTGALFRAAAQLGAISADADEQTVEAVGRYAEQVGVAFQIRDDVLDASADAERLGKPSGRDADLGRPSIVEVTDLSPAEANERAHETSAEALDALDDADVTDSRSRTYLEQLATFVVERER